MNLQQTIIAVEKQIKDRKKFHEENVGRFKSFQKTCSCKRKLNVDDVEFIGENAFGVWWNCKFCGTTGIYKQAQLPQVAKRKINVR